MRKKREQSLNISIACLFCVTMLLGPIVGCGESDDASEESELSTLELNLIEAEVDGDLVKEGKHERPGIKGEIRKEFGLRFDAQAAKSCFQTLRTDRKACIADFPDISACHDEIKACLAAEPEDRSSCKTGCLKTTKEALTDEDKTNIRECLSPAREGVKSCLKDIVPTQADKDKLKDDLSALEFEVVEAEKDAEFSERDGGPARPNVRGKIREDFGTRFDSSAASDCLSPLEDARATCTADYPTLKACHTEIQTCLDAEPADRSTCKSGCLEAAKSALDLPDEELMEIRDCVANIRADARDCLKDLPVPTT